MQRWGQIQSWNPEAVWTKKGKGIFSQQPQKQRIKAPQSTWYTLHLWNTWIDNESSQSEVVDFGSNDFFFFPFSLFVSVYVYASVCDFVCIALLLPFVLGFSVSVFFSIVFNACYHWWFVFWFGCSLLSFFLFFNYFKFFLIFYNYFLLFIIMTLFSFFLSFFLPFILSHVDDRVLVLWPSIRPVPLRWESWVQDIGPPEISQLHVISNGKNLPEISISTPSPSSTQQPASNSAGHPMPNN